MAEKSVRLWEYRDGRGVLMDRMYFRGLPGLDEDEMIILDVSKAAGDRTRPFDLIKTRVSKNDWEKILSGRTHWIWGTCLESGYRGGIDGDGNVSEIVLDIFEDVQSAILNSENASLKVYLGCNELREYALRKSSSNPRLLKE